MCTLQYIWYVSSDCFCVTKCPGLYMLLMYQLRSSSAEIAIHPGASRIGVDVIVWAMVSESAIYREKLFFEAVWFPVCDFISEEDGVEKFCFVLVYGVVVEEVIRYCKIFSIIVLSNSKNMPNFQ